MPTRRSQGFSLSELLIVVAIVAIFSAISINAGIDQWKRERVNAMAIQLAGWLETTRRFALKGTTCTVLISSGSVVANSIVAQTTDSADATGDNNCLPNEPLRVMGNSNMSFSLSSSPTSTFSFTPRGTLSATATTVDITLTLSPSGPSKCVQVSGLLGMIAVGQSSGGTCTVPS